MALLWAVKREAELTDILKLVIMMEAKEEIRSLWSDRVCVGQQSGWMDGST